MDKDSGASWTTLSLWDVPHSRRLAELATVSFVAASPRSLAISESLRSARIRRKNSSPQSSRHV